MLGTFPSKHSRVNLQELLARPDSKDKDLDKAAPPPAVPVTFLEQANYFSVCFFYALGPSLLDIFLSRLSKVLVADFLRGHGYSHSGNLYAYLYALALSAYSFSKCGSAPFTGHLSDQLGRRKTLTFTLLATSVCLLLTAQCTGFLSLLLCRFVTGLFSNGGLLTAYAADIADSLYDRTTLFSYFITAWAFARVAAAYIFPLVGEDVGACCWCAFVCEVLAALLTCFPKERPTPAAGVRVRARSLLRNPLTFLRDRPSFRAAFREMLRDRLVALLFVTSLLMPRIDIAAYLWQKFEEGPKAVGYIKALESVTVILVPMTPAIPWCARRFGHAGAAVLCAALMAACWLLLVDVRTMHGLYAMVLLRSAISTVYEPSIKSILMDSTRARKREQIGSLTGLQQTMKGMAQVMGSFWGSFLASQDWSAFTPLYLSALWCAANAAIIYFICCSAHSSRNRESPDGASAAPSSASPSERPSEAAQDAKKNL